MRNCPKCNWLACDIETVCQQCGNNLVPEPALTDKAVFASTDWVAALAKIVESARVIAQDLKQSHYFYTATRVSRVADAAAELQRKIESAATEKLCNSPGKTNNPNEAEQASCALAAGSEATELAELRRDKARLEWLMRNSALHDGDGEDIVLVVTDRAVKSCAGTWLPKYQADVRAAIDVRMSPQSAKSSGGTGDAATKHA
jgi:hypothetical protein